VQPSVFSVQSPVPLGVLRASVTTCRKKAATKHTYGSRARSRVSRGPSCGVCWGRRPESAITHSLCRLSLTSHVPGVAQAKRMRGAQGRHLYFSEQPGLSSTTAAVLL